jgi:hypothetical protein
MEPFGEERADLRHGVACALLANINRGKNSTPFKPIDFMLFAEKPKPKKMDESAWQRFKGMVKSQFKAKSKAD